MEAMESFEGQSKELVHREPVKVCEERHRVIRVAREVDDGAKT